MIQQVNELEFNRRMAMFTAFFKWMRMDNRYPVYYMGVSKQSDSYHVRDKQYRQKPLHYM